MSANAGGAGPVSAGQLRIKQRPKATTSTPMGTAVPSSASGSTPTPASQAPKLKAVIRRLPASMSEAEFHITTSDYINKDTCEWIMFVPGKVPEELVIQRIPTIL